MKHESSKDLCIQLNILKYSEIFFTLIKNMLREKIINMSCSEEIKKVYEGYVTQMIFRQFCKKCAI